MIASDTDIIVTCERTLAYHGLTHRGKEGEPAVGAPSREQRWFVAKVGASIAIGVECIGQRHFESLCSVKNRRKS